jgi:Fic family protein
MDNYMNTPEFKLSQTELKLISEIDAFKGKWQALSTLAPEQLIALRKVATVESIASSTRIEGVTLSDREVEELLSGLQITNLHSRDEEEVAGYAECIEQVFESFPHILIDENHIKQLHQVLLKYSSKDTRHRGEYKKLNNHVEAFDQFGKSAGIVFKTASPFDTPQKMTELTEWLAHEWKDQQTHSLLTIAVFIVHFLAIHPFQDGNGRLSRILTTLLLLQAGYGYVLYSSLERVIEENKEQYYLKLRRTQQTIYNDNETIMEWTTFFLRTLRKQVSVLEKKIDQENRLLQLPVLSQTLLRIALDRGKLTVRDAVQLTGGNRNTIKRHLSQLVQRGALQQEGTGKGTWYRPA